MFKGGSQLGISVSDRSIEIVEISLKKETPLLAVAEVKLESGVVEHGVITDEAKFVAALRKGLAAGKPKAFSTKRVVLALPDVVSFLHVFRFPPTVTREEMRTAVRFQAEELIPLKPEETVSDFIITEHGKDHVDVMYVAVDRATFEAYRRTMRTVGVELVAMGVDAAALARLLSPKKDPKEATMIADLGARTSTLLVVDQIGIRSSFTRFTAGEQMTQAVAEGLKLDAEKAEAMKIKNGVAVDAKVKTILLPFVERMGKDIVTTIDWHEEHHDSKVKEIVFVGGTSLLPGLLAAVAPIVGKKHPGVTLRPMDIWQVVKPPATLPVKKTDASLLAPAIGAAFWGIRAVEVQINLLTSQSIYQKKPFISVGPVKVEAETKTTAQKVKLIAAALFFLFAIAGLVLAFSVRSQRGSEEVLPTLEEQIAEIDGREFTVPIAPRLVHVENLTATETVTPQVYREEEAIASGQVTLKNTSSTSQPLVATTRLLSAEGVLFRLKEGVIVPANGEIVADVYADQAGASGNIGPTTFTIPGLAASRQAEVYGESSAPMTGGVVRFGEVTLADLDAAVALMKTRIEESVVDYLGATILPGEMIHPDLVTITATSVTSTPELGADATEIEVTMIYTIDAHPVAEVALDAEVRRQLDEEGTVFSDEITFTFEILTAEVSADGQTGTATVIVTVNN